MKVALAGLTAREEMAMAMLIGKTLPGFQCTPSPQERQAPLPLADLYVLDLAGRGLARWTPEAEEELLRSLHGAPAVLVAPVFDETWQALDTNRLKNQSLVLLRKPYGIDDMRAALLKAAPRKPLRPASAPPPVLASAPIPSPTPTKASAPIVPTVAPVRSVAAAVVQPSVSPVPAAPASVPSPLPPQPVVVPVDDIAPLNIAEFQTCVAALPASEPKLFLCQLAEALRQRQPFEVRVTLANRLIVSPDVQWAASNLALPLLEALCQSDTLAADLSIDPIESRDALGRAERLDMHIQPLASFLGALLHHRLNRPY